MERETLARRFAEAHELALVFARSLVIQNLPDERRFLLHPCQSYDGNSLGKDEEVFPQNRLPRGKFHGPWTEEDVIGWLWREGKVPQWVNVYVISQDEQVTYIELLCCGRFSAGEDLLYHRHEGHPPFHVLGPCLPPSWESVEKNGQFDLYRYGRNYPE